MCWSDIEKVAYSIVLLVEVIDIAVQDLNKELD